MNPESLLAHADFVRALARRLLRDEHRADDVVQDTWVAALEHPPRTAKALRSWLSVVTHNIACIVKRGERRRSEREQAAARHEGVASTADVVEWEATRRRVVEAVLGLEEPYRSAIVLRFYQDLPPREMAKRLGVPAETARTRVKRGLERLKARLDGDYGGDRKAWCLALAPVAGLKLGGAAAATSGLSSLISGASVMATKVKVGLAAAAIFVIAAALVVLLHEGSEKTDDPRGSFSEGAGGLAALQEAGPAESDENQLDAGNRASLQESSSKKIGGADLEVYGRVLDEAGDSVEGVVIEETRVDVYSYNIIDNNTSDDAAWTDTGRRTDPKGRFSLHLSKGSRPLTFLRFHHPDYIVKTIPVITAVPDIENCFKLDDIRLNLASYIFGKVVDEKGNPVENCRVSAPGKPWETSKRSNHDKELTDEEGRFRLKLNKRKPMCVTAYKEDAGMGWVESVIPGRGTDAPDVKIVLQISLPIAGRIFSGKGAPAAGIRIYAEGRPGGRLLRRHTYSDDEGRFRLPPLPPASYRIETRRMGIPGNKGNFDELEFVIFADEVSPGTEDLLCYLPLGSKIIIHCRDKDGNPVPSEPGVGLMQRISRGNGTSMHAGVSIGKLERIALGTFGIHHVQQGSYYLNVSVKGYASSGDNFVEVPDPPGQVELSITLYPIRAICGHVFNADGTPAPDVTVLVERRTTWSHHTKSDTVSFSNTGIRRRTLTLPGKAVATDEEGYFRITGIRKGKHLLCLLAKGREVLVESDVAITDEKPHAEVSLKLPPLSGSIKGAVRDGRGLPVDDAIVVAWDGKELFNTTRSDIDGRYAFLNMPDGRYVVDARGFNPSRTKSFAGWTHSPTRDRMEDIESLGVFNAEIQKGGSCRCDLTIPDPFNSIIKGKIVPGSGSVPEGLDAYLSKAKEDETFEKYHYPSIADLFDDGYFLGDRDTRTAHFRFENLPSGQYRIQVSWHPPGNWDRGTSCGINSEVINIEHSSVHELDIYLPFSFIGGSVTDKATGEPITGARVILLDENYICDIELDLHEDGTFEGREIPAGKYTLLIHHPQYGPFIKPIELLENVGQTNISCPLEPGCSLEGVLKLADGERRLFAWHVMPEIPPINRYWYAGGRVSKDGRFLLQGLPSGEVKLIVLHRSKPVSELTVTLPLPEGEKLVMELPE